MKSYVMGIDFGSTTSKTVILDMQGAVVAAAVSHKGSVSDEGARISIADALAQAGITQRQVVRAVSTGYGRRMLEVSDKSYTEITCHARGAVAMVPYERGASWYHRNLPRALDRPGLVLGSAAVAFVGSMALVPMLGLDLIPQFQQGRFEMTVTMPPGTPLADTDRVVAGIQRTAAGQGPIATVYGVSGSGTRLDANPCLMAVLIVAVMAVLGGVAVASLPYRVLPSRWVV